MINLEEMVQQFNDFLHVWHNASTEKRGSRIVLDVVQVAKLCVSCERSSEKCKEVGNRSRLIADKRGEAHLKSMAEKVKDAIEGGGRWASRVIPGVNDASEQHLLGARDH